MTIKIEKNRGRYYLIVRTSGAVGHFREFLPGLLRGDGTTEMIDVTSMNSEQTTVRIGITKYQAKRLQAVLWK